MMQRRINTVNNTLQYKSGRPQQASRQWSQFLNWPQWASVVLLVELQGVVSVVVHPPSIPHRSALYIQTGV
jgi:hypothetical protein